ncbi:hypothetical protein EYC84_010831 [Monilinia fructicola]|uniref:Uncharacterized protein n=1 Tax=Monilinia fructicola TaxID=38448 RepID=A0A5M9J9R8_MONFR|nr:hypothetical protein EYC84_010831 [Monilinia fructicola]
MESHSFHHSPKRTNHLSRIPSLSSPGSKRHLKERQRSLFKTHEQPRTRNLFSLQSRNSKSHVRPETHADDYYVGYQGSGQAPISNTDSNSTSNADMNQNPAIYSNNDGPGQTTIIDINHDNHGGLPKTPGWVPKLTPTRRGNDLFLNVQ